MCFTVSLTLDLGRRRSSTPTLATTEPRTKQDNDRVCHGGRRPTDDQQDQGHS